MLRDMTTPPDPQFRPPHPDDADALLARIDTLERSINEFDGRVNALVDQRIEGIRNQVREEEPRDEADDEAQP